MSRRSRILSFGFTVVLVLAGVACALVLSGGVGQISAFLLIGTGFVLAMGLVFLEVGLSEDKERARERQASRPRRPKPLPRPKLERSRGHQRRLR